MNILVKFKWSNIRYGRIEGVFICTKEEYTNILNKNVYFGEVLGKHSDVWGTVEECELTIVSEDQVQIAWLEATFGTKNICGYNPLSYIYDGDIDDTDIA